MISKLKYHRNYVELGKSYQLILLLILESLILREFSFY